MSWIDLLKQNFSCYIKNDMFEYREFTIPLLENNREKIMCMLTAGQLYPLSNNKAGNYRMEYYINDEDNRANKPIDCALVDVHNNNEYVFAIQENKINCASGNTLDATVRNAVEQVYNNYFEPCRKAGRILDMGNESNLFITVSIYNPDVFLARKDHLHNYLNSTETSAIQRFEKFGFVYLTALVNTNSIRSCQELVDLFREYLVDSKTSRRSNFSFVPPHYRCLLGRVFKGGSKHDLMIRAKLSELNKLPFFNPNPVSDITNVRNFTEDRKDKLEEDILHSLLSVHKQTMPGPGMVSEEEAHRSLGAKPRILSYNENKTIVLLEGDDSNSQNSINVKYITTDMSVTDGQHSSRAFIDILDKCKSSVPALGIQKVIRLIYKDSAGINWNDFGRYVNGQDIDISVSGYKNSKNAQAAAKNQNSIRAQTSLEIKINANRPTIMKIAEYWNSISNNLKLCFNKSSYDCLPNQSWRVENPSILVPVYALWGKNYVASNNAECNKFLSKNGAGNAIIGSSLQSTLEWLMIDNKNCTNANKHLDELKALVCKLQSNNDLIADDNAKPGQAIQDTDSILDEIHSKHVKAMAKLKILNLQKRLNSFETALEDEEYDDALKHIDKMQELVVGMTDLNTARIDSVKLINDIAFKALSKTIPFLGQFDDSQYYWLTYYNTMVRNFYRNKNIDDVTQVKKDDLELIFEDAYGRLINAEKDPTIAGKSMTALGFAKQGHAQMDAGLYTTLFG